MTYRVVFDYGDIEIVVMTQIDSMEDGEIQEEAQKQLKDRGFELPRELFIMIVEAAPEWEEE